MSPKTQISKEQSEAFAKKLATQDLLKIAKDKSGGKYYDWTFLTTYVTLPSLKK